MYFLHSQESTYVSVLDIFIPIFNMQNISYIVIQFWIWQQANAF